MARPRPNRLGMYADLIPILDAALASGGGTYTLPAHGTAVHWRQRAYKFRKLYAETMALDGSKYDKLVFPAVPKESSTVVIKLVEATGVFIPASSAIIDEPFDAPDDDLLSIAESFAKSIGGNDA